MTDPLDPQFASLLPDEPLTRRDFIATAIGAAIGTGFALAVQPVCAQSM